MGQHTQEEQAKALPETYMLKLPVCGVFYEGGVTGTRIPLSGRGLARHKDQIQYFLHDMGGHGSGHPTDSGRLLEGIPEPETREKIEWADLSVSLEGNTLYGWLKIQTKASLSESEGQALSSCVEQKFAEGWGGQFSDSRIAVAGGCLRFWFEPPKDFIFMIQKKYKVTQISHPQYPWIYRIQALKTVNGRVGAGTLGGFVQSEGNLSQEGACWIYDDAVSYDDAVVEQDAELHDGATAADFAIITGDACLYGRAWAGGDCRIESGEVKDDAVVAGEAVVKKDGNGHSPLIAGNSRIYGTVSGRYIIKDTIFPGETYQNPTEDILVMENGKRSAQLRGQKHQPPEKSQKAEKRRGGMER